MNKVSYTVAPFKFHKNIRYCQQYRVKSYSDSPTLQSFLKQFTGKSGIYSITTEEGTKIGITKNISRRLREHIPPMVKIKSLSFLVFNVFPHEELRRVENLVKTHYRDYTIEGSSEFFKDLDGFEVFNKIKYYFHKSTAKRNRCKDNKVEFKHHVYKLTPKYTTQSKVTKEALEDFYL